MTIELIIYFSIIAIFVILVRHLPSAFSKDKEPKGAEERSNVFTGAVVVPTKEPVPQIQDTQIASQSFINEVLAEKDLGQNTVVKESELQEEPKLEEPGSLIKREEDVQATPKTYSPPIETVVPDLNKINSTTPPEVIQKPGFASSIKNFFSSKPKNPPTIVMPEAPEVPEAEEKTTIISKPAEPTQNNFQFFGKKNKSNGKINPGEEAVSRGDKLLEKGKLSEAEEAYLKAVAQDPKNPKAYNRLGAIYLKNKNFKDALESFEAARDLDGGKASRHYNVALAAFELKDFERAELSVDKALKLSSDSASYKQLKDLIASRG